MTPGRYRPIGRTNHQSGDAAPVHVVDSDVRPVGYGSSRGPQRRRPDRSLARGTWSPGHVLRHFWGAAEVRVVAAEPVLAARRERVEHDGVLERFDPMRHAAGDQHALPRPDLALLRRRRRSAAARRRTVAICSFGCSWSGTTAPAGEA